MFKCLITIMISFSVFSCTSSKKRERRIASLISSEAVSASDIEIKLRKKMKKNNLINVVVKNISSDGSGCYINILQEKLNSLDDPNTFVEIFIFADNTDEHTNLVTTLYRVSIESFNKRTQLYFPDQISSYSNRDDNVEIKIMIDPEQVKQLLAELDSSLDRVENINLEKSLCE